MNEEEKYIEKFKESFAFQFGYYPNVTIENKDVLLSPIISLESLKSLINSQQTINDNNISSLSRKREIVVLRTIFCMIAADIGHSYAHIGTIINRNHSTVIYNIKSGYDLLETDLRFQELYIRISTIVNPIIYPHARINEITDNKSDYTKSTNTVRMHTRRYHVTRPCSRQKGRVRISKEETIS